MRWLWFIGPLAALLVYVFVVVTPSAGQRRWREEIRRWLDEYLGPLRIGKNKTRGRRVKSLSQSFEDMVQRAGGGSRVTDIVLIPKLAYLAVRAADGWAGSEQQTIVCQLEQAAPDIEVRPLPVVDGRAMENTGLEIDDDDFMDLFVVESEAAKAAVSWLDEDVCESLKELPEVWLSTHGRMMTLSVYGEADAERLDELLAVADAIFAAHGADPGRSLFGAENEGRALAKASAGASYRSSASHRRAKQAAEGEAAETPAESAPVALRLQAGLLDAALYAFAVLVIAVVLGVFEQIHPRWMFNTPDVAPTETWQGGWTTKGFGAFVAAETLLVGLIGAQSYLSATRGRSIGKLIFGLRTVRLDGAPMNFWTGTFLRSWLLVLVPLAFAAATASPHTLRATIANVAEWRTVLVLALTVVLTSLPWLLGKGRALHDRLSGTDVVLEQPIKWPAVELVGPSKGLGPVMQRQLWYALVVALAWVVMIGFAAKAELDLFGF